MPTAKYDQLDQDARSQLKQSLLREQGFTCCYCMSRIDESTMRVEHWHPKSQYPDEQLDYRNLLAACHGNEGGGPDHEHCDVKKGDQILTYNPADPNVDVESKLRYTNYGEVRAIKGETALQDQLGVHVLNLNCERLVIDRRSAMKGALSALKTIPPGLIRAQIARWENKDSAGRLPPYSGAVLYALRRLEKRTRSRAKKKP